jgi:hypothetical protein
MNPYFVHRNINNKEITEETNFRLEEQRLLPSFVNSWQPCNKLAVHPASAAPSLLTTALARVNFSL